MAGDQDGFPPFITEVTDKGTDLRDSNGIKAVDRFVQDQKLRIMHDGKGDGQPLFHAEGILGKQLFISVRQAHQIQRVLQRAAVRDSPQSGKNAQVFRGGQIRIKSGGLDQAADPGQQLFFICPQRLSPDQHLPGGGLCQPQQHFHGCGLSGPVSAKQAVDTPFPNVDIQIGDAFLRSVLFGKMFCFNYILSHFFETSFITAILPRQPCRNLVKTLY